MDYELMSKKLNAVIPDETWEALEEIASREMRTKSQMAAILLAEAIVEYRKRHSLRVAESNLVTEAETAPTEAPPTETKPAPATKAKRGKRNKEAS